MRRQEPFPPLLQKLYVLSIRVLVGGALGYACTIAILAARVYVWGDRSDAYYTPTWPAILEAARSVGLILGAIYYPLAAATLLEKENLIYATLTVTVAAIFTGTIAFVVGGSSMVALGASIGFWFTCAAIYRRRGRNEQAAGFDSYFR
jgi:hypothetical protein